jgi:hypothetical protein
MQRILLGGDTFLLERINLKIRQIAQYKDYDHLVQQTREQICLRVRISVLKSKIHLNKMQRGVKVV